MPLPTPRAGESQSDFVSRCMSDEEIKRDFGKGSKQAQAVCFSQFRKEKKQSMREFNLTFQAPIKENALFEDEFIIKGTAITSTITDNNHKFLPEELEAAADTMKGIPLLVDHDNRVDSIVGKVKQGFFESVSQSLEFEAMVDNKSIQEKISKGLLDSVSIGATVEDVLEEDGVFTPIGIKIRELSLVAVPADENSKFVVVSSAQTFQMALKEAYELRHPVIYTNGTITSTSMPTIISSFSNTPSDSINIENKSSERGLVDMEQDKDKENIELKTQLAEKEARIAEFEAKERSMLEVKYIDLCKTKKIDSIDIKEMDNKVLDSLIKQVDLILLADVDEETKDEAEPTKVEKPVLEEESEDDTEEEVEETAKYKIVQRHDSDMLKGNAFTVEFKTPESRNYI